VAYLIGAPSREMKQLRFFHGSGSRASASCGEMVPPRVSLRELHRFPSRLAHESGDKLQNCIPAYVVIMFLQRIPRVRVRSRHALVETTSYLLRSPSIPPSCSSSIMSRISNVSRNEATLWITLLNAGKCFCAFAHMYTRVSLSFLSPFLFLRSNSWLTRFR